MLFGEDFSDDFFHPNLPGPWFDGDINEYTDDKGPEWAFLSFAERFAALEVSDSEEE